VNQRIRHLTVALIVLFGVLFVQATNWQVVQRDGLVNDSRNNRVTVRDFNQMRGSIVTADGVVVAATEKLSADDQGSSRFSFQRVYPHDDLYANITGYYTLGFGRTQLERVQNDVLAGKTTQQQVEGAGDLFSRADTAGSVHLTINSTIQKAARDALGKREGSVVVMDPVTGAVLAMYSNPTYNPNVIAVNSGSGVNDALIALQVDERKPLLANAYQERYMPGSTFKVVTTAIGFDTGALSMMSVFKNERQWLPPNTTKPIRNYGKKVCGGDMAEVFRRSCNIPFAQTVVAMGPDVMVNGANRFGIDERVPFDLPGAAASTFGGTAKDFEDSLALLAIHGFGQGQVQMTPLHMTMITSSVANSGQMMKPFVVHETRTQSGTPISTTAPAVWKAPMAATTAASLTQLMIGVAQTGTASCCLRLAGGVSVAAKTGTAQLNPEGEPQRSHAWITAFAPATAPRYAITVFIKGVNDEVSASTGGRLAGPIAKTVLDTALSTVSQPTP
jgi:peptidoglycan glycosyltransferase